ncbi:hypothetical protein [Streptomyces longisporus]|uniref:Uncharacterized protein n=1 Tax=Streptomyces longisporus TaxID=1948 RepID=A0ABP5ZAC6_STRLO
MAKKRRGSVVATAVAASVIGVGVALSPGAADARGVTAPNVLSPGLAEHPVAQGSLKLENPTDQVPYYGYLGDATLLPDPTIKQAQGVKIEASKTEPDKNTYLRLSGPHGADASYLYGTHPVHHPHQPRRRPGAPVCFLASATPFSVATCSARSCSWRTRNPTGCLCAVMVKWGCALRRR